MLGRSVAEVMDISASEYEDWQRFWNVEPWGSYRDNLHTAMLCVQILRPHLKKGVKVPPLSDFMLISPEVRKQKNATAFLAWLSSKAQQSQKAKRK